MADTGRHLPDERGIRQDRLQFRLHLGDGPRLMSEGKQCSVQGTGLDADAIRARAPVGDPRDGTRRAERRVVARGHEMERSAHHGRLDDGPLLECALEIGDGEARESRPQRDIWRIRVLRLEPGEPADRGRGVLGGAFEERLAQQCRSVELTGGQLDGYGTAHPSGGSQSVGASSKPANSKAGVTMHPTSVQRPRGRAACHAPAGTTT